MMDIEWSDYDGQWVATDEDNNIVTFGDTPSQVFENLHVLGKRGVVWRVHGKDDPMTDWTEFE